MKTSKTCYLSTLLIIFCLLTNHQSLSAKPTSENTVNIHGVFEIPSLDPTRSGYSFNRMQILETLVNVDSSGHLTPGLASEWNLLDEGKIWELTIREGVTFHDGSPLNAQVIVDNLNLIQTKPSALNKVAIQEIKAIEPNIVRITLAKPYRPLGAVLAHHSASILAPKSIDASGEIISLIGTGPFSVHEVSIPHKLVVKRFEQYWGQKASIEYASYLTGHRAEARALQARSGQADIVFGIDPAAIPTLKRLPDLTIIRSDLPRTLAIKINSGHPLLQEKRIREALSLAIDRKGIATAILKSPEVATEQLLHPYMNDWYVRRDTVGYNLNQAQKLLTEAGWKKDDKGWLKKEGKPFELSSSPMQTAQNSPPSPQPYKINGKNWVSNLR